MIPQNELIYPRRGRGGEEARRGDIITGRHWDRRCYYCPSREKWFPQTNFWEKRPARSGLAPTSLSRHNYRVILNAASGNYDETTIAPRNRARGISCEGIPHPRRRSCMRPRRYLGNCWAAKQPAVLSCTNHSSTRPILIDASRYAPATYTNHSLDLYFLRQPSRER